MLDAKISVWLRNWRGYERAIVIGWIMDCICERTRVGRFIFDGFGGVNFLLALFHIAFA